VAAAFAMIEAKAFGYDTSNLKTEFNNLSVYADKIQEP
jgi:hypothetical protein